MDKLNKRVLVLLAVFIVGIGGLLYMYVKAEEREELEIVQRDLANHLYNNYRLYTSDEEKERKLTEEFNQGKGDLTTKEHLAKAELLNEYEDIEKIEFTGFSKRPMGGLEVAFTINDVYPDTTTLDTIRHETRGFVYRFRAGNVNNSYVLDEREEANEEIMSEESIIYYEGGIKGQQSIF